jgi:O-acetyl-ADP-ribose deacetylase (regulator of RNase III)
MRIIEKDIMTVTSGVICQQVNCRKVMNAGLGRQIRRKWPQVYRAYMRTEPFLGRIHITKIATDLRVCNIYGQANYGHGRQYTAYVALDDAFRKIAETYAPDYDIYIPEGLGCGLAGGDWKIVSRIIELWLPDAIICRRPR